MHTAALDAAPPLDAVVLGLGAVGSAALLSLSDRGARVVGLDQHGPAHDRGSSHGHTRVYRHAYFEHPDYVPLLRAATEAFAQWETRGSVALLQRCGVLVIGPHDSPVVQGCLQAAHDHGLALQHLGPADLNGRYPQFHVGPQTVGLFEPDAGFVRVEASIRTALDLAQAPRHHHARVVGWERQGTDHIVVHLADHTQLHTRRLVVAAGAWTPRLLPALAPLLSVTRQVQAWLAPAQPALARPDRLPCWLVDRPGRRPLYGVPMDPLAPGRPWAKVAVHGSDRTTQPQEVDRTVGSQDRATIQDAVAATVPGISGPVAAASVCLYTTTPDEHFLVDRLPDAPEVVFAAGLSGHGFKMAPALGRALAELALDGQTPLPVDFLGLHRFARGGPLRP